MLPPMRPRPITPICMSNLAIERRLQRRQASGNLAGNVNVQGAPAALEQDIEITARLRSFDHAETGAMPRNRQIFAVIGGDLQEYAAVRPALVSLPGRMQKSRAEFETGCNATTVAHDKAHLL